MALNNKKLSKEKIEEAVEMARAGNYRTTIGRALGVHPDTFFRWLDLGRTKPEEYPEHADLLERLEAAEAEWEVEKVGEINSAASQDARHWTASMTMLERKFPDRWGKREHVTIEGERPVQQLNQVVLIDSNARELARDLLRRVGSASPHEPLGLGMGSESEGDGERVVIDVAPRPPR